MPNLETTGANLELTGWTHTRDYAYGFINGNNNQLSYAKVHQLTPGQLYEYALYQFDNQAEDSKYDNNYRFGYIEWYINDVSQIDLLQESGPDVTSKNQPTARGVAMANDNGEIVFKFKNNRDNWGSRSSIHINLSGISVVKLSGTVPPLSPPWVSDATPTRPDAYPSNGLKAWYCPGEFGASNNQWTDCSGNGNDATLSTGGFTTGTHYAFQDRAITGTTRALYGTTAQSIDFGSVLGEVFTLCSVTRYAGGTRRRILEGKDTNWLHGHWNGQAGSIFYAGFKTAPRSGNTFENFGSSLGARLAEEYVQGVTPNYQQKSEWVVACTTGARGGEVVNTNKMVLLNGIDFGNGVLYSSSYETGFRVNGGGETSDFGIVEVVVWDRALSDSELQGASAHLMNQMGMSLPRNATYQGDGQVLPLIDNGDCGERIYQSGAWELGENSHVTSTGIDTTSDHYMKWVTRAVHYCLLYDSGSTHVTVWTNAGYQCFKADSYGKECTLINTGTAKSRATFAIAQSPPPPTSPSPPSPPTSPSPPPPRFHLRTTQRTWQAAKQACEYEGMTLASVFSAEEDQQVDALVNGQVDFVWLGGNDMASEGNWVWDASGESVYPYTNWGSNEPNNEGGIEHVMLKDFRPDPPVWIDAKDYYERAYVCQELQPPPPGSGRRLEESQSPPVTMVHTSIIIEQAENWVRTNVADVIADITDPEYSAALNVTIVSVATPAVERLTYAAPSPPPPSIPPPLPPLPPPPSSPPSPLPPLLPPPPPACTNAVPLLRFNREGTCSLGGIDCKPTFSFNYANFPEIKSHLDVGQSPPVIITFDSGHYVKSIYIAFHRHHADNGGGGVQGSAVVSPFTVVVGGTTLTEADFDYHGDFLNYEDGLSGGRRYNIAFINFATPVWATGMQFTSRASMNEISAMQPRGSTGSLICDEYMTQHSGIVPFGYRRNVSVPEPHPSQQTSLSPRASTYDIWMKHVVLPEGTWYTIDLDAISLRTYIVTDNTITARLTTEAFRNFAPPQFNRETPQLFFSRQSETALFDSLRRSVRPLPRAAKDCSTITTPYSDMQGMYRGEIQLMQDDIRTACEYYLHIWMPSSTYADIMNNASDEVPLLKILYVEMTDGRVGHRSSDIISSETFPLSPPPPPSSPSMLLECYTNSSGTPVLMGYKNDNAPLGLSDVLTLLYRNVTKTPDKFQESEWDTGMMNYCGDWNGDAQIDLSDVLEILYFMLGTKSALYPSILS